MGFFDAFRAIRRDGWYNAITGLGTALRDKSATTYFSRNATLTDDELDALFNDNDLAETIVSAIVDDSLRQGIEIHSADDGAEERLKALHLECDRLGMVPAFGMAAKMGRLFGAAAVYPVLEDGQDPATPLDRSRVRQIYSLLVVDKQQMQPDSWYTTASSGKIGRPETYRIMVDARTSYSNPLVHESRLVLFGGLPTTRRRKQELNGWDRSALQPVYDVLRKTGASFDGVMQLMADMSQAVWKVKNLMGLMGAGEEENIRKRMEIVELARSAFRAIILDAEGESFERQDTTLTGADKLIDKMWQRVATAAKMPMTRLFRISPGGLNATGESDTRNWYDEVGGYRRFELLPRATSLVQLIASSIGDKTPEQLSVCFPSLWQLSPTEDATLKKTTAETDGLLVDKKILLPAQVALQRYAAGRYSTETKIDIELYKKLLKSQSDQALEPPTAPPAAKTAQPSPPIAP
jgi:uncharacterized protein